MKDSMTMAGEDALRVEGLCKRIGDRPVLDRIDLALPRGEIAAVLGASGAGKTTLLRLIAGLETPDDGIIRLDGQVAFGARRVLPPERRRLGYLAQEGALFPHLSVADNVAFGLAGRRGASAGIMADVVARMLELVNLPASYRTRFPHELSGGEQQRVALARALAPGPRLVLLDEPFSSLDSGLRTEVREAVLAALKVVGASAVLVTHDPAEAMSMGDRVAVLIAGRIAQYADPVTLYRRPVSPEVGRFVGQAILLDGTRQGARIAAPLGLLTPHVTPAAEAVQVLIRPEQIGLVPPDTPGAVAARVQSVRFYGQEAMVTLRLDGPDGLSVPARVFSHALPAPGDRVGLIVSGPVSAYARPSERLSTTNPKQGEKQ